MTAIATPARPTQRGRTGRVILYIALSVGLIATLVPFAWMLLGSIKPTGEIIADPNA